MVTIQPLRNLKKVQSQVPLRVCYASQRKTMPIATITTEVLINSGNCKQVLKDQGITD